MKEIRFRAWEKEKMKVRKGSKGMYKQNGYVLAKAPYHPSANKRGYVPLHRLVMENQLGRYLTPRKELVHHIDGNRENNDLSNLKLTSPREHYIDEHFEKRNANGRFVANEPIFGEIKFRLYDRDKNIIQVYSLQELISKTYRRAKFEFRGRFTGLKDKNGTEIYEGDILSTDLDRPYLIVEFRNGAFMFQCHDNGKDYYDFMATTGENSNFTKYHEVIGSIYENSELLEDEVR